MKKEKKILYVVLDESGAMHLKDERYFVIGGYYTTELTSISSLHKKIEKELKILKKIPLNTNIELKSSKLNKNQFNKVINNVLDKNNKLKPISIVIDKKHLTNLKANENTSYNLFVKHLLAFIFNYKLQIRNYKKIYIRLDARSISTKNIFDLEGYLRYDFFNYYNYEDNFELKYLDSKQNGDIQIADYISNYVWKNFNSIKGIIIDEFKTHNIIISKFPYKYFGI